MKKRKSKGSAKGFHGDITNRPGKATKPTDHVAHNIPNPDGGLFQGKDIGLAPQSADMPQTMRGPIDYPGQELGA